MATVEYFDSGSGTWEPLDYSEFSVEFGVSDVKPAPTGEISTTRRSREITAADRLRVRDDSGDVVLAGDVESAPTQADSTQRVTIRHDLWVLLEETVSISVASPTDEQVYQAAIDAATTSGVTLSYAGTATSLADDYSADGRSVKRIFRDMADRTGRVWWIGTDDTVHVEPRGNRGLWQSVDTASDPAAVRKYNDGSRESVLNDVTVVGTGDVAVTGSASDSTSINTYGRQPDRFNVAYITSSAEADNYASALLVPDPLTSAEVVISNTLGDATVPRVNYELDLTDDGATGADFQAVIERHTFEEGASTFGVGEGDGVNTAKFNRRQKSSDDTTKPGSVYGGDRIADNSVDSNQLVDSSVIEAKLDDLAVTLNKVDTDAIDETKIQDGSISTPLLQASAVIASKIAADTITANEIAADTITALEIAADTITANQIDTLVLSTNKLSIGSDADTFLNFSVETLLGTGDTVVIEPSVDRGALLGTTANRFASIRTSDANIRGRSILGPDAAFTGLEDGDIKIQSTNTTNGIRTLEDGAGQTSIIPTNSNEGAVGLSSDYWSVMHAGNFITQSPPEITGGVDLEELRQSGWYDPPEYVRSEQQTRPDRLPDVVPDDLSLKEKDTVGVELGHMSNYLLEVCKAQQERIAEYEQRLSDLETRLSELEGNA